ncbi:hypothetical protein ACKWTF_004913 [Chironomus riparius]
MMKKKRHLINVSLFSFVSQFSSLKYFFGDSLEFSLKCLDFVGDISTKYIYLNHNKKIVSIMMLILIASRLLNCKNGFEKVFDVIKNSKHDEYINFFLKPLVS